MIKSYFIHFLLVLVTGYVGHLFLPFWIAAVVAMLVAFLFKMHPWGSFISGFFAVALLWSLMALLLNSKDGGVLSAKIGEVFNGISSMQLVVLTGFIGGLLGGFGSLTGSLGRRFVFK